MWSLEMMSDTLGSVDLNFSECVISKLKQLLLLCEQNLKNSRLQ